MRISEMLEKSVVGESDYVPIFDPNDPDVTKRNKRLRLFLLKGQDGEDGLDGKSAYQIWLDAGNTGTVDDFLNSLQAEDGIDGVDGVDGKSAYQTWLDLGNIGTEQDFINSLKGADGVDGKSTYEIWLDQGNTGTEAEFLAEVQGVEGPQGPPGESAYQTWLDLGNIGTEAEFIASLEGSAGPAGQSAYELWIAQGNTGTEAEFLASLEGAEGKSAYQSWLDQGNTGTEAEFIASLEGLNFDNLPSTSLALNDDDKFIVRKGTTDYAYNYFDFRIPPVLDIQDGGNVPSDQSPNFLVTGIKRANAFNIIDSLEGLSGNVFAIITLISPNPLFVHFSIECRLHNKWLEINDPTGNTYPGYGEIIIKGLTAGQEKIVYPGDNCIFVRQGDSWHLFSHYAG